MYSRSFYSTLIRDRKKLSFVLYYELRIAISYDSHDSRIVVGVWLAYLFASLSATVAGWVCSRTSPRHERKVFICSKVAERVYVASFEGPPAPAMQFMRRSGLQTTASQHHGTLVKDIPLLSFKIPLIWYRVV